MRERCGPGSPKVVDMEKELTETLHLEQDDCDTTTETAVFHAETGDYLDPDACFAEAVIEPDDEDHASGTTAVRRKARYRPVDGRSIKTTLYRALDDGTQARLSAVLIDFSAGGARIFADECIPFEEPVGLQIDFDGRREIDVTGQVRWIRGAEGGGALLGLSLTPRPPQSLLDELAREKILERRDELRSPYDRKAQVQWESSLTEETVRLRDVSPQGVSLQCEIPPQVGRRGVLRIRLDDAKRIALKIEVRWQSHDGGAAVIGCAILEGPVEQVLEDLARQEAKRQRALSRWPTISWAAAAAWACVSICSLVAALAVAYRQTPSTTSPPEVTPDVNNEGNGTPDQTPDRLAPPPGVDAAGPAESLPANSTRKSTPAPTPAGVPSFDEAAVDESWKRLVPDEPARPLPKTNESAESAPQTTDDSPAEAPEPIVEPTGPPPAAPVDRLAPRPRYLRAYRLFSEGDKAGAASELIAALHLERLRPIDAETWAALIADLDEPGRSWLHDQRAAMQAN